MSRPIPVHPLLAAAAPVLLLLSANAGETTLISAVRPILIAIGVALVLWAVLAALLRSVQRGALLATALLLMVAVLAPAVTGTGIFGSGGGLLRAAISMVWALLTGVVAYGALKVSDAPGATRALNLVLLSLTLVPAGNIMYVVAKGRADYSDMVSPPAAAGDAQRTPPDVYHIIVDGYGRADVLKDLYGYDNSPFLRQLEDRGFVIADRATANYCQTALSLSSTMNMSYLTPEEHLKDEFARAPLAQVLGDNALMRDLEAAGHTTIAWGSGYTYTEIRSADLYVPPRLTEFERALVTKLLPSRKVRTSICARAHAGQIVDEFDGLGRERVRSEPVYVFAHIIAPHPPFLFTADGTQVTPEFYAIKDGSHRIPLLMSAEEYRARYTEQLRYINLRLLGAVERITAASPEPCVIIIQGDHGPGSMLHWESAEKTNMRERLCILHACLAPEEMQADLYDDITPVNTFRLILNYCLGSDMPLLEDRSYFSKWSTPYDFIDVTELARGEHDPAAARGLTEAQ